MNPIRVQFIREKLLEAAFEDAKGDSERIENHSRILTGKDVLDIGCGGGLLSEVRLYSAVKYPGPN
jgi:polyprenyldihydroxybenzoate methyltransferase / 3-demethylubiquinol 3-O-methyltransferase